MDYTVKCQFSENGFNLKNTLMAPRRIIGVFRYALFD